MFKIIDYGFGNIHSILNMLEYLGFNACIINDARDIKKEDILILPGVGSYDNAITSLKKNGFYDILKNETHTKKIKLIGICLGMQLMCEGSEEGNLEGLGLIRGFCKKNGVRIGFGEVSTQILPAKS